MRLCALILTCSLTYGALGAAVAFAAPEAQTGNNAPQQVEVTADQTLEWYQNQGLYVARGNAKAVRGDLTVSADLLTAHQRATTNAAGGKKALKTASDKKSGDIDKMTAEGNVVITKQNARIYGDRAVDDVDRHVIVVTGKNLRYETDAQYVTAKDSLEYWDETKIAVARGNAEAVRGDRHIKGDVLTAEFRDQPNGSSQLYKMTALGHVTVITKSDVVRGDKGVYDAARDIAIVTGNVRITRGDGTELTGDVGESDFAANQSRLMNQGSGRVRALLPAHSDDKGPAMPKKQTVTTGSKP